VNRTVLLTSATVVLASLVACMVALLLASMKPAEAAFPGKNGYIAFVSDRVDPDNSVNIYRIRPDGTGIKRLTHTWKLNFRPAWSADGTKIAFDTGGTVRLMNADGSNEIDLTKEQEATSNDPAWYPSGRQIVYHRYSSQPVAGYYDDLFTISFDAAGNATGPPTRLTTGSAAQPEVSPSGEKIVFTSSRGFTGENWGYYWELYVIRADAPEGPDNQPVKLTKDTRPYVTNFDPVWSPNGSRIAFTKTYNDNSKDIFVINADGTGVKNLTKTTTVSEEMPAWSPDGNMIAFVSNKDGDQEIWKMRADGSRRTQVTKNATYEDTDPDWQPRP
jgi:Tol biopolymer transport system component